MDRRAFHKGVAAAALTAALPHPARAGYQGPNVILVRFGGGVRRAETVVADTTYAPFLVHDLIPRGAFIPDLTIAQLDGVDTSHAEGTLNLLTGRYLAYRDAGSGVLSDRLEPTEPTLFEYLRAAFALPSHQALLVNGEDRPQEEFFTYGTNGHYGIAVRAEMLSLYRFKLYKFAEILREGPRISFWPPPLSWTASRPPMPARWPRRSHQRSTHSGQAGARGTAMTGFATPVATGC